MQCRCLWRSEKGIESFGAGVIGGFQPHVGVGQQMVLCNSSEHFELLAHLSSSSFSAFGPWLFWLMEHCYSFVRGLFTYLFWRSANLCLLKVYCLNFATEFYGN